MTGCTWISLVLGQKIFHPLAASALQGVLQGVRSQERMTSAPNRLPAVPHPSADQVRRRCCLLSCFHPNRGQAPHQAGTSELDALNRRRPASHLSEQEVGSRSPDLLHVALSYTGVTLTLKQPAAGHGPWQAVTKAQECPLPGRTIPPGLYCACSGGLSHPCKGGVPLGNKHHHHLLRSPPGGS